MKYEEEIKEINQFFFQTFSFSSFHFNSLDMIFTILGRASSAAITFKNESRVRRARISTAVRAYSFIA